MNHEHLIKVVLAHVVDHLPLVLKVVCSNPIPVIFFILSQRAVLKLALHCDDK